MTFVEVVRLAAFGLAGLGLGAASLAALKRNTTLYLTGDVWRSAVLHLARLAVVAGALAWTAFQGAGPLLAAAAGLVLARPILLNRFGRAP